MVVKVRIPAPLRSLTGEQGIVTADGASTLRELVDELEVLYPGIRERLCEGNGELRRFVNVFVNGEDVRFLSGIGSLLAEGDDISIVPAVAGGSSRRARAPRPQAGVVGGNRVLT